MLLESSPVSSDMVVGSSAIVNELIMNCTVGRSCVYCFAFALKVISKTYANWDSIQELIPALKYSKPEDNI